MNQTSKFPIKHFIVGSVLVICLSWLILDQGFNPSCTYVEPTRSGAIPGSCTTFAAQIGNTVLFGNNEDYSNPNPYIWVVPSSSDAYGGVYFGWEPGRPQGGLNEKGLAYDGLALPPTPLNHHPDKPEAGRYTTRFFATILASSATVEEAIQNSTKYNWGKTISHQVIFADASGDAAVIGPGLDGELAITRKPAGDGYLAATNFNLADPANTEGDLPCWRYETALSMLADIQDHGSLSVDSSLGILDAVHVEGANNNTVYSNVFDLKNGEIYLVYWHQFDEVIKLNVKEEITKGSNPRLLRDVFSDETVGWAETEFLRYQGKIPLVGEYFIWGWYLLTFLSLIVLVWDISRWRILPPALRLFWPIVIIFLGAVGMISYWVSYRKPHNKREVKIPVWQCALGASAVSAAGYTVSFLIMLVSFYLLFPEGSSGILSLIVPFLVGLLIFRTPLVASLTKNKYHIVLRKSLLVEFISTLFTVAGLILTNSFLIQLLGDFYPRTMNPGQALFWGTLSLYGLMSLIVIYPFHLWLAGRGYPIWIRGFEDDGEISLVDGTLRALPLREGWFFLLIGVGALVLAGILSS